MADRADCRARAPHTAASGGRRSRAAAARARLGGGRPRAPHTRRARARPARASGSRARTGRRRGRSGGDRRLIPRVRAPGRVGARVGPAARAPRPGRRTVEEGRMRRDPCAPVPPRCHWPCRPRTGACGGSPGDVVRVQAAAEDQGNVRAAAREQRPVECLPGAAAQPRGRRPSAPVDQVEVGVEALEVLEIGSGRDPLGLDHARARATGRLGAEGGALVAVQLEHRQKSTRSLIWSTCSSVGFTNTPTRLTCDVAGLLAMRSASAGRQCRGEPGQKISPTAQAPSSTASSASARLVTPQILTWERDGPHL